MNSEFSHLKNDEDEKWNFFIINIGIVYEYIANLPTE